jgi:multiple sugar transport system permease protein
MRSGKSRGGLIAKGVYIICVALFLAWSLLPIAWSAAISITPQKDTMSSPAPLVPAHPTLENYRQLFFGETGANALKGDADLYRLGLLNSLVASVAAIVLGIPIAVLSSYALARMEFKGRELIRLLLLATMVIPVFAVIVPLFQLYSNLGMIDNFAGLTLVYTSAFLPLTTWLLCSFFETLPKELEEAATIDGCTPMRALTRIILPLSFPVIFAASLIVFISTWNQFLIPLVLAPSLNTKPIAVVISEFATKHSVNYGLMNAGGLVAVVIPACMAVVFRKFLISGLSAGATKG